MGTAMINFFGGLGTGYNYTCVLNGENELKQGKNFYLSTLTHPIQLGCVGGVAKKLAETLMRGTAPLSVKILYNTIPLLSLPFSLIAASVKHGHYTQVRTAITNVVGLHWLFPEKLSQRTTRVLTFCAEHTGNIAKVAMITGAVALTYFGSLAFGGAILAALAYREIDAHGFVPRKLSLFLETHLPRVSSVGILIGGGSLLMQVFAVIHIATIIPQLQRFMTQKTDAVIRHFWPRTSSSPSLAEFEAPWAINKSLSLAESMAILNGNDQKFEINPAHCSKPIVDQASFPVDSNFEDFYTLYNKISWKTNVIQAKLQEDDRFKDEKFSNCQEKGVNTVNLTDWSKQQMRGFVDRLQGKVRAEGQQQDLDTAIENAKIILAYIKNLRPSVEKEDLLLKLAVEGGNYCARAMKRVTSEILDETIVPKAHIKEPDTSNPQIVYEIALKAELQNARMRIIQSLYQVIVSALPIPKAVSRDVHGFDIYRKYLAIGFYPLTKRERDDVGLLDVAVWNNYLDIRVLMLKQYKEALNAIIKKLGMARFTQYMRNLITTNKRLSYNEKNDLLTIWLSRNDSRWGCEETIDRVNRLLLVNLGILRLKQ